MITTGADPQAKIEKRLKEDESRNYFRNSRMQRVLDNFANVEAAAKDGRYENIRSFAGEEWLEEQRLSGILPDHYY